jgi:hypothetical protein
VSGTGKRKKQRNLMRSRFSFSQKSGVSRGSSSPPRERVSKNRGRPRNTCATTWRGSSSRTFALESGTRRLTASAIAFHQFQTTPSSQQGIYSELVAVIAQHSKPENSLLEAPCFIIFQREFKSRSIVFRIILKFLLQLGDRHFGIVYISVKMKIALGRAAEVSSITHPFATQKPPSSRPS